MIRQSTELDEDGGDDARPQPADQPASDVFLNDYDTSKIIINDETTDRLLGLLVVLSNIFN